MRSIHSSRRFVLLTACVAMSSGCSVRSAAVDGLFGGVSDGIATAISTVLLGLLGVPVG